MNVRYYIDPATGKPHIGNHDVDELEVEDVLKRPGEDRPGGEGSREKNEPARISSRVGRRARATGFSLTTNNKVEEEAVAEDEAAFEKSGEAVMEVPYELIPVIRELIAKHRA